MKKIKIVNNQCNNPLLDKADKESKSINDCITEYISYIVGLISITGFVNLIVDNKITFKNKLFLIVFVLVAITMLFEIIWYKFKSHNRYSGLYSLITQEKHYININCKKLNKEKLDKKEYIKKYHKMITKCKIKFCDNSSTYGFYISKFYDTKLHKYNYNPKLKMKSTVNSISKNKYIFSVPNDYIKFIEINNWDKKFFEKIIWELYGDKIIKKNVFKRIINEITGYFKSFGFLFTDNSVLFIENINIDKRYTSSGWKYPKKITQIAYLSVIAISIMFFYLLRENGYVKFTGISGFKNNSSINMLLLLMFVINVFWIVKYIKNLKNIIYGTHSIDGYCWNFFPFRVSDLNNKGIIPIYYSRSFIRFFKTNLYIKSLNNNSFFKNVNFNNIQKETLINNAKKVVEQEILKMENCPLYFGLRDDINKENKKILENLMRLTNEDYVKYINKLLNYKSFGKKGERYIHNAIVKNFKIEHKITGYNKLYSQ